MAVEPIKFSVSRQYSRRLIELAKADGIRAMYAGCLDELDEAIAMVDSYLKEDGETIVTVTVEQIMKPKEKPHGH